MLNLLFSFGNTWGDDEGDGRRGGWMRDEGRDMPLGCVY